MPELPEVETVVIGLRDLLSGHKIIKIDSDWPKGFIASKAQLRQYVIGSQIVDVYRLGKLIVIKLDSQYVLTVHLKMTGQLVYIQTLNSREHQRYGAGHPSDGFINSLPDKTTRVIIDLDDGGQLFFNDMRKFGWMKLIHDQALLTENYIQKLGPDALSVTESEFINILANRHKKIKVCLLDQTLIAGCGNIYADESLWLSQIAPWTLASQLTAKQLALLCRSLKEVMFDSIAQGGSSSRNYINAKGEKGKYLDNAYVYQKKGHPCRRCETLIQRIVIAGRGTHICEECQK